MKIKTKKKTTRIPMIRPVLDKAMIHPNNYTAPPETRRSSAGRRNRDYLPTIIYTVTLTSQRLDQHWQLVSFDDMEELNKKLSDLHLASTSKEFTQKWLPELVRLKKQPVKRNLLLQSP
jgi:hypothetical protein